MDDSTTSLDGSSRLPAAKSRSLSGGKRIGSISAFAIASGEVLHTLLAVFGLAALLQASIAAFLVVKCIESVYLVYLGAIATEPEGLSRCRSPDYKTVGESWRSARIFILT